MIKDELIRIAGINAVGEESPTILKLCKTLRYVDCQLNCIVRDLTEEDVDNAEIKDEIYGIKNHACEMLKR